MTEKEIIANILAEWTQELIDDMTRDLQSRTKSKANALAQSITPDYIVTGQGVSMNLFIADYYRFVDEGVSGTEQGIPGAPFNFKYKRAGTKFAKAISGWIAQASVPDKTRKGKFDANKPSPLAYAIATSIKKRGLKPKLFFKSNLTQDRIDDLKARIAKQLSREINITLLQ